MDMQPHATCYSVRTLVLVTVIGYNDAVTPALVSMDTLEMTFQCTEQQSM